MLKTILSVSGKAGLFKLISRGSNMLIVESLVDNKRIPVYAKDKVIALSDVAMFTEDDEVPLYEVMENIKNLENAARVDVVPSKMSKEDLSEFMAKVLPTYDRERVYPNDMRKLITWYNLLIDCGITSFAPETAEETEAETAAE